MTYLKRPYVLVLLAVAIAYANVFGNEFLFDDEFLILKNGYLESFATIGRMFTSSSTAGAGFADAFYRPMQGLAYLLVNQAFGREAWAFHGLNVGLHAANACLVYALGQKLRLDPRAALIAALLWAVHPLHVEAISYMSATADPLHALFVLTGLYVAAPSFTPARLTGAFACAVAGVLAKESAIVFPALLTAIVFYLHERRTSWRAYLCTLPFWAAAGLYFVLRKTVLHLEVGQAFFKTANAYADHASTRVYTALAALPSYLELLVWPHDLHMDREFPTYADFVETPVLLGALIVGLGLYAVVRGVRSADPRRRFVAFVVSWVGAAHAPHAGVLIPVNSVFLEHWMYLTAIPLFWWTGTTIARWTANRRTIGRVAVGVLVVALTQKTLRQNRAWATPITFFTRTLEYSPTSARIRHNLAIAYSDRGDDVRALEQYEKMIAAGTPYAQTFHNAAFIYFQRNQMERAEPYFLRALALDPTFFPSAKNLAILYSARGDRERAEEYLSLYRRLHPTDEP